MMSSFTRPLSLALLAFMICRWTPVRQSEKENNVRDKAIAFRKMGFALGIMICFVFGIFHASPMCGGTPPPQQTSSASDSASALRTAMRKLWSDHVFWTRDYIIAAVGGQPDEKAAATRLLANQDDIGNAVASYYGADAGQKLTGLLKQHILIAGDLIKAAKAHNQDKQQEADREWQKNAEDIADFLSHANPYWPRAALVDLMNTHLSTTTTEVVARLNKDWDGDAKAFDAVYDHILKMSDALSDGIIKQFPGKFGTKPNTPVTHY